MGWALNMCDCIRFINLSANKNVRSVPYSWFGLRFRALRLMDPVAITQTHNNCVNPHPILVILIGRSLGCFSPSAVEELHREMTAGGLKLERMTAGGTQSRIVA